MLLRAVLRRLWGDMPTAVLASPLTTDEGKDLPSKRASEQVLRQLLPRGTAMHSATYLIKDPSRWEADVKPEVAAEIADVLTRHVPALEATAEMFEILPRLAAEESIPIMPVGDDAFFRLAYRAAVRQLSGCTVDGDGLRALLGKRAGPGGGNDGGLKVTLYAEVMQELADPQFRETLEGVLEEGWRAREHCRAPEFLTDVWGDVILALCRLLDDLAELCLVELDGEPGWDAVLDAGANRWGLRRTPVARQVALGRRVPNALPPPLDRTVAERLGSLLGRGTDATKLREAGRGARELLLESAARASEPLGLSEPSSRSSLALGMFAAALLQAEDPSQVTDRYGKAAQQFGMKVSDGFSSVTRLLRYPAARREGEDGSDDVTHEGDLGGQSGAGADDYLVDRALADWLRALLSEEAADELTAAVWKNVHRREVLGLDPLTVGAARDLVRMRAVHVSNEMSGAFRRRVVAERRRVRLPGDIMAVLERLPPEDARAIATTRRALLCRGEGPTAGGERGGAARRSRRGVGLDRHGPEISAWPQRERLSRGTAR